MRSVIHVVRHGEVDNPHGILYGRLPGYGLSELGKNQAEQVAQWLAGKKISYLGVSPLQRAQETAEPISAVCGVPISTDPDLIEAENLFQGQKITSRALIHPRYWLRLRNPFRPSWGEPYNDIAIRMHQAVEKARIWDFDPENGGEAVIVSHQLPIWILRLLLSDKHLWHNPSQRECSLASITTLEYQGNTLTSISYCEPAGASDPKITGA